MPAFVVSGTLGGGKTLAAVGRIREYVLRGRPVATNINLNMEALVPGRPAAPVYRIPDRPTVAHLEALGQVHDTGREELNGALVLDECGTWLNAREWGDKGRPALIDWFLHSRKLGWDVYFVVQSPAMLDKQLREVFKDDYTVHCKRTDRLGIPYLGAVVRLLTFGRVKLKLPAMHVAVVVYGHGHGAIVADRWWYKGRDLWPAYSTAQMIRAESDGLQCLLHPGSAAERAAAARAAARRRQLAHKRPEVAAAMQLPERVRCRVLSSVWASPAC